MRFCFLWSLALASPASVDVDEASRPTPSPVASRSSVEEPTRRDVAEPPGVAPPEVDDPMLEPLEPAPRVMRDWRQATGMLHDRSTALGTAHARIAEAKARSRAALSRSLPSISAEGVLSLGYLRGDAILRTRERMDSPTRAPSRTEPNVRQTIDLPTFPQRYEAGVALRQPAIDVQQWGELKTARMAVRQVQLDREETLRLAIVDLAANVVNVVTAERLAEVRREFLRANLSTVVLMQRRAELGAAGTLDVLRAEQEVALSRAELVEADETVRQTRESLGMALGHPEQWGVPPEFQLTPLLASVEAQCPAVAAPADRPDVRSARLALDIASRELRTARYGWIPTLDVVAEFRAFHVINAIQQRATQWSIGAFLTVPIYEGGRIGAERRIEAAQRSAARARLTELTRDAELEVFQSTRAISVAHANLELGRKMRDLALETMNVARTAFVHGTATGLDLIDAARVWKQAELDLAVREFEHINAKIAAVLARSQCSDSSGSRQLVSTEN